MPALPNVPSSTLRRALHASRTSVVAALLLSPLVGCLGPDRSPRVAASLPQEQRVEAPTARLDDAVQTVRALRRPPAPGAAARRRGAVAVGGPDGGGPVEGGEATVDGEAIDEGTALPAAFTVERRFDACRLFADDRLELTGRVVMQVAYDPGQPLRATVDARELRVRAREGVEVAIGDVFDASERLSSTSTAFLAVSDRHLASTSGGASRR